MTVERTESHRDEYTSVAGLSLHMYMYIFSYKAIPLSLFHLDSIFTSFSFAFTSLSSDTAVSELHTISPCFCSKGKNTPATSSKANWPICKTISVQPLMNRLKSEISIQHMCGAIIVVFGKEGRGERERGRGCLMVM